MAGQWQLDEDPVDAGVGIQVGDQGQQVGVWVAQDDSLAFVPVRLGRADLEGQVQVLDGLKPGDAIVLYSEKALSERSRIHVVERIPGVAP